MARADDLDVLEKRVVESRPFTFNFSPKMSSGETILSVTALTKAPTAGTPTALTLGSPAISGQQVQVQISGGSNNGKYLMICQVLTSLGNTLQCEGYLLVRDPS